MRQVPAHEDYLWGNPAFVCALLMTQAFGKDAWNLRPGGFQEIDGLPLHIYKKDGEPEVKPCAEVLFAEQAAEMILENGLTPLASLKDARYRPPDPIPIGGLSSQISVSYNLE